MVTLVIFLIIFILESITFLTQEQSLFLYVLLPAIFYLEKEFRKEPIKNNNSIFFSYIFFLIFCFLSFLFSINKINSANYLLFLFSSYFLFLIGFNEKKIIEAYFKKTIIGSSFLFCFLSLLPLNFFRSTALQLVYPLYPNHNHLGDFLGLNLIVLINDLIEKRDKKNLILTFFFLPFFLFSFSRSAYLDLLIILFLLLRKIRKKFFTEKKILFGLFFLVFFFFVFSQREIYQIKPLLFIENFLIEKVHFQPRSFFSGRPEYFSQAIKGFLEKPFFGWGPGNFQYLSKKYVSENLQQVLSALNLPLTVLAEVGFFGFLFFLLFFWHIIKNIDDKKSVYKYLFYYFCLNFLTDYTYAIFGLFLLLFLLAGLIIKEEKNKNFELYPLLSFFAIFLIFLKLTGKIFTLIDLPEIGILFYPYDHQTFQNLITKVKNQGELKKAINLARDYEKKSFISYDSLSFLGDFYSDLEDKNNALRLYQRLTNNNRFPNFEILKKVYYLKKEKEGKSKADGYFHQFFKNFKTTFWISRKFEDEIYKFCFEENIAYCRFRYYYTPPPNTIEKSMKDLPIKATYTFNNEGFNERFNYQLRKPKNTFRILILGDSNAFGFLVNTKENWVEKLEDKLKTQNLKLKTGYKNIEVINLSYHSYDLAYAIERFRWQGNKYQPDLIIFMNSNFYRINEIFLPLTEKYSHLENNPQEKERFRKEGKHFPSWNLAWEEYLKKVKEDEVYQRQKDYLKEFFSLYKGKVFFISFYEIPSEIKNFIKNYSEARVIELLNFPKNKKFYYKEIPSVINAKGHEKLAEEILKLIF